MMPWTISLLCMTCDARIAVQAEDGDEGEARCSREAYLRGWHFFTKRDGRSVMAHQCEKCVAEVVTGYQRAVFASMQEVPTDRPTGARVPTVVLGASMGRLDAAGNMVPVCHVLSDGTRIDAVAPVPVAEAVPGADGLKNGDR